MFFKGILIPVLGLISSFWSYNTTPVVNLVSGDIVQDYRYTPSFSVQGDVDFIGSYYSDPVTESGKLSPIVRYLATYGKSVSEVPYLNIAVFSDDSSIKSVLTSLQGGSISVLSSLSSTGGISISGNDVVGLYDNPFKTLTGGYLSTIESAPLGSDEFNVNSTGNYVITEDQTNSLEKDMATVANGGTGASLAPGVLTNIPDYGPDGLSRGNKWSKTVRNTNGKKYLYMFNIGAILDTTKSITPTNGLYFVNGVIGHAGGKVTYRTTRDAGMQIPYTLLTSYPDGNGGFSTTLLKFKKDMGNITNGGKSIQDILSVGSFGYYNDSLVDNPSNVIRNEAENSIRIAGNGPSTVTVAFSENVSPTNDISFEFGNGRWKKYAVDSVRDGDSITYNNEDFSVGYLADDSEQMTVLTKNDTSTLKAPPYRDVAKNLLIGYFYKNWLGSDSNTRVGVLDIPGGYRLLLLKDVVGGKAVMNGVDCQTVGITDIGFTCKKVSYPYASQVAVTAYSEVLHDNASTYSYYEVQSMNLLNATVSNETFKLTGSVFRTDVNNSSVMKRVADRTYYSAGLAGYMNFLSSPGDELSEDYMFIKPNSFEGNVLVNAKMKSKYTGVTFMASEVKGANVLSVYGPDNSKAVPGAFADIPDWTSADGCSNYSSSTKKVAYNTSCLTGLESNKVRVDLLAGKSKAELDSLFNVIVNTKDGFASDSIFTDKTMKPSDFPMTLNIAPSGTSSPNAIANFVLVSKIDGSKAFSDNITIRSKAIVGCSPSSTDGFLYDPAETHGVSVCKDVDDTQKGAGFTTFKVNLKEIQGKYLREGTINVCYDNPDYFELQPSSFFGQGQSAGYEGTYGKGGNSSDYRYSPKKMVMDGKSWTCHELKLADIFPGTYSDNSLFFVLKTKQQSVASVKRTTLRVIKDFKFYDLPGGYVDLSGNGSVFNSSEDYKYSYSRPVGTFKRNLYMSMYSVTGQDTPLYSFSALPGDKASVLKSKNAMDEYSMMRLEYYLPAGGPVSGQYTAGRVNALDRSAYGGVSYLESFGNDGNGNASYVGDSAFASDIKKNAYQFPAYSSVGYSGTARTTGYTTFIDRVGGINYLGSHSPPNYGGSCWTTYNDYEYNGPNIDDRVIDSHGRDIVRPNPAQYLVETAGTAYAPVKKFQMTFALNVPVRLFSYSGSQNDYTFVNMLEPTFKGGTMNGDSNGIVYADLNDVKKNRVSTDPANPYALSKVQAGIGRDDPVIFLDKRLQGKVDKIYTERTYLFRESQDINARWCSWNPGSPYQLKRSNLGNVPGSTCGKLYQFLNYDKAQDQEGSLEGNIPDSNGIQGAKIMIRLRIVLKDLSEGEIKSGNDKAQLLLQNGGESMFIMDVPVKYAGAFSSFVENTLLAQDNPGQQFSAIGSDGINALDIKKVNEVIESINNFNSQKFSFFTYGVNMEKKIYTDVTVGHLTQRYSKRTTECCNDDGDCNTSYGIENGSSWFTKTGNKFIDFSAWSGNSFWYSPIGDLLHVIGINNTSDWEYVDLDYDEGNGTYRSMVTAIGNDTNFYGNLYGSGTEVTVSDILDGNNDKKQPSACELFSNGKRYEKIHTADPIEVMSTIENSKYDDGKVRVIEYTGPEIVMLDSTNKEGVVKVAGKWVLRSRSRVTFAMNVGTIKSVNSGADDNFLAVVPRDDGSDGVACGGTDPGIRIGGGVNSLHNVALMSKDISTTFSNNILAIDGYVVADSFACLRKNVSVARFAPGALGIKKAGELIGDADGSKNLYDQYLKKGCSVVENPLIGATLYQSTLIEKSK